MKSYVNKLKDGVSFVKNEVTARGYDKKIEVAVNSASDKTSKAQKNVTDFLDTASGQKIFNEMQKHIALQEQYNDVLANKLSEALKRIEVLEEKLNNEE
ncbi:MAG: hypothetical protein OSB62_07955 [Alphaproteobacteria bacterium]|nr:hypothetical protein [Alphaproteobacteria bacterium]